MGTSKNKLPVTILILSLVFIGVIGFTAKRSKSTAIENGAVSSLNVVQGFFYKINVNVKDFFSFITSFNQIKNENSSLKEENSKLQDKALAYDSLKSENDELKKMLNFTQQSSDYTYKGCDIIGKVGAPWLEELIINVGSDSKIAPNMVVLDSNGCLVGQITYVGKTWSRVETFANGNIRAGIMVNSTRESSGIIRGYKDANNKLMLIAEYLPLDSKINKGDIILTSGDGNIYPPNIKIGTVKDVTTVQGKLMKSATVEPFVNLNKLEKLLIVIPKNINDVKY